MTMEIKPLTEQQISDGIETIKRQDKAAANRHCSDSSGSADLRTPTITDLMQLLQWAGAEAGGARAMHYNDRSQSSFSDAQDRMEHIHEICLEAIGRFPAPMRKSPWVKYAEQNTESNRERQ